MNLIPCRCTNCGANMQVDESKETAICAFCGTTFLVKNQNDPGKLDAAVADRYWKMVFDFVVHDGVLQKYNGKEEKVVIPNGVTEIRDAFKECTGVKSIVIPDTVTEIGNGAFYGCANLTEITIPESVTTIGAYAFEGCKSLPGIQLPGGLKSIRLGTFINCSSLTSIVIPDGVLRIGDEAFRGCTSLTTVTMPDSVIEFGSTVFGNCPSLREFIASPDWKADHAHLHNCLQQYQQQEDAGEKATGACYVATAVYGSYDCPQVWVLRRFRDERLAPSLPGRVLIRTYYALSPTAVRLFGHTAWFRRFWRARLDRMVQRLKAEGVADTPYRDKDA